MTASTETAMTDIVDRLKQQFAELEFSEFRGQVRVAVSRDLVLSLLGTLNGQYGFDFLVDVTGVDYLNYRGAKDRFGLVYVLTNTENGARLTIRTYLNEPDLRIPSVVSIWEGANWMEREVYDMFGIEFEGHPDLRRILLPEEFEAHPLRKDYPLQGRGERHNFPTITRGSA